MNGKAKKGQPLHLVGAGQLPARQLRCRGAHHTFALDDWIPGETEIPRGVTVMPASDGRLKLVEPCTSCWAVSGVTYTLPGGVFDPYMPRQLVYGSDWVRMEQHEPRGRRLMRAERYQRGAKQIEALLTRVTEVEDEAPLPAPAVFRPAASRRS